MPTYIGIDIAKESFEAALPAAKGHRVLSLANNNKGFQKLHSALSEFMLRMGTAREAICCVMEASGPYGYRLASFLHAQGLGVAVVNPVMIKRFAQMRLSRTKTDRADAILISSFAETMGVDPWSPAPLPIEELQQLRTAMEQLNKQRTQLRNALKALEELPHQSAAAQEALRQVLRQVEESIEAIDRQMKLVLTNEFGELYRLLLSIQGIGPKTALELIVITHGFTRFRRAKALVAYIGLCPRIYESGTSVRGRARLSKLGMARTRRMLYMGAQAALRWNEACRVLFERLVAAGKPKMVALMAVAHKLVRQAFAVATRRTEFVNGYGIHAPAT